METIISNITATTPIGRLTMSGNDLTKVPPGLTKFTTIAELNLGGNQIAAVDNGALAVSSSILMKLDLRENEIETIEQASLPRK